ncbi:MAG TPA: alpha/beta hydrolase [Bryobacteraceae bacterium]|nr:alpha/beta hydrolase [Bryobacteraceae bacterium]
MKHILLALVLALPVANAAENAAFQVNISGHGQPMILIPGLSSSGETWDSTVAHYKDRYECHVFTLAGFAGVPPVAATPDHPMLEQARDQIAAYIRQKKLVRPVIVGHSLGGFLALGIASRYPDLPGKLVIVDAYPSLPAIFQPDITAEQAKAQSAMTRKFMSGADPEQGARMSIRAMVTKDADFERVMNWSRASHYPSVVDAMVEMYGTDLRDAVASIQSPALVLATWIAYKDYSTRETTEANARRDYAKLKGVDIRFTDTARHFIMYDDPEWFFTQIDGFLGAK